MYTVISKNSKKLHKPDPDMEENVRVIGSLKEILLAFETPGKVQSTSCIGTNYTTMSRACNTPRSDPDAPENNTPLSLCACQMLKVLASETAKIFSISIGELGCVS